KPNPTKEAGDRQKEDQQRAEGELRTGHGLFHGTEPLRSVALYHRFVGEWRIPRQHAPRQRLV
ncbi:MAG TPA: hypothetical protein VHI52_20750, partial [Verrucomicrobiae bacterium]|nr:hypothetical protein [Verrucomicrobiae bacterium]